MAGLQDGTLPLVPSCEGDHPSCEGDHPRLVLHKPRVIGRGPNTKPMSENEAELFADHVNGTCGGQNQHAVAAVLNDASRALSMKRIKERAIDCGHFSRIGRINKHTMVSMT